MKLFFKKLENPVKLLKKNSRESKEEFNLEYTFAPIK